MSSHRMWFGPSTGAATRPTQPDYGKPIANPALFCQLPPLRTASGRSPSPRVRWRLLEALYGYALTLRLFNGDWAPDPGSAADVLLAAAPFLGCATVNVDCGSGSIISPLTVKSSAESCMLWRMSQEVRSAGVKGEPALPSL